ncbi:hypothetical protein PIB30_021429 [Stylosanthes scabra]|uniref:Ubiquitin-like domain-containing protein n=1 Tax=Stylosanthes scabra TaxID=79078 RepID=A0ABU6U7R2_9FABA|nr:hypothetical protein [Stylosanthes scabra]
MAKLKIRGASAWSGLLEDVAVDAWTVPKLREEVAMRANCSPDCITLIFAGKILKDDDADPVRNLANLGVKNNSKILATRISPQERLFIRVEKIRVAANEIEAKHRRRIPVEDLNREAEDPTGQLAHLGSEMERRAVMLGARLHAMAVNLIGFERYTDALEALSLGEEAFSVCDPNLVEVSDPIYTENVKEFRCQLSFKTSQ